MGTEFFMKMREKAMRKGICVAGNMVVDITYPIVRWPKQSELTTISGEITRSVGGAVCNVVADLARMDQKLPLTALGVIGQDREGDYIREQLDNYPNVDQSFLRRKGTTSFTAVMSDNETKSRTFFHYRGSNTFFDETCIDWERMNAEILHVGYLLLLDALDQEDDVYGTKMGGLLAKAQSMGIRTSIDVASESGRRFQKLVPPALKYTDYCIINELEAQQITGVTLRDEEGILYPEHMLQALEKMKEMGVALWAVVHCPEGSYGLDEADNYSCVRSLQLPKDYIKGTVGAGDAFCAGVLYGGYKKWSLKKSMHLGTCAAAASLGETGATEGLCSVEQVLQLEQKYGKEV